LSNESFVKKNVYDWLIAIIAASLFLIKLHPALVLLVAAFLGLILTKKEVAQTGSHLTLKTFKFFLIMVLIVTISTMILYFVNKQYFLLATIMLRIDLFHLAVD